MKMVINACFGGYGISKEAGKELGIWKQTSPDWGYSDDKAIKRTDERLIKLIEERGSEYVSGDYAELEIVEIPDEATDWILNEYDGSESIYYVVDGKIHII